ncbi:hypothetical protein SEA_DUBLIN_14 [Mycobacterium phage Dublin]|nr:hypothetical protein SEA_DUBLIN_14 [Mycobacterium phage Dublin]QGJ92189.1 hypothetical protein SEA_MARYSWELL_14 [Mycobacterium phage MarysWell]
MTLYPKPEEVNSTGCDHWADPPVVKCIHDWRIVWGNMPRTITGEFKR